MVLMVGCSPESTPSKTGSRAQRCDPSEKVGKGDVRPPSPSPKRVCEVRETYLRRLGADDLYSEDCRSIVGRQRREMGEDDYAEFEEFRFLWRGYGNVRRDEAAATSLFEFAATAASAAPQLLRAFPRSDVPQAEQKFPAAAARR